MMQFLAASFTIRHNDVMNVGKPSYLPAAAGRKSVTISSLAATVAAVVDVDDDVVILDVAEGTTLI